MKFVIVEDEIRIREGIRRLLPKLDAANIVVGEAENGKKGLELIQKECPDVIITDVRMPVMDGLEMLENLQKQGCKSKVIILSAYSEFEYARTAIRLGVTEYLLKPINISDFSEALGRITIEFEKESRKKSDKIGNINQVIKNILNGDLVLDEDVLNYLESNFEIYKENAYALLVVYLEEWNEKKREFFRKKLTNILMEKQNVQYCILEDEKIKEMRLFLYNYEKKENLKRFLQSRFLNKSEKTDGVAMGWTEVSDLSNLKYNYEKVQHYLDWVITMGDDIIISYPEIENVQTTFCVYPLNIEEEMKNVVCSNDCHKIQNVVNHFHAYFQEKVYDPQNIKDCYVRFFWSMINFSKEAGNFDFTNFDQRQVLEKIIHTKTRQGLRNIAGSLLKRMKTKEEEVENLNVRRALAMIYEFYRTGITLDEIASKLSITPEYLGTQFHQEMGMTFSTYIKNLRIEKAKKLLLSTGLKLYEISEQVGYTDPKYFSKVFKAETGLLPAEYRRTYK